MGNNNVIACIFMFLIQVAERVCSRHSIPIISDNSMGNTVALRGQDVDFTCKIDNLGRHMVAFIRQGSPPRLISFDEKIFRQRDKYELKSRMGPVNNEWVLTIKNVQEKDRGNYTCQINTDPVTVKSGELDIRVAPSMSHNTASAVEVREGHNVSLLCLAEGNPKPTVIWRRQDRQIIRYNGANGFGASVFHGASLNLTRVNRKHMSEYVCVASNGIPPDESFTVKLLVTFVPLVVAKESSLLASLGSVSRLVCTAEAWPRPDVIWEIDGKQIFDNDDYATSQSVSGQYHSVHVLEIRRVRKEDYGTYRCTAKNDNGAHYADINLEESKTNNYPVPAISTEALAPLGSGSYPDDEDSAPYRLDSGATPSDTKPQTHHHRHHESVYYTSEVVAKPVKELRLEHSRSSSSLMVCPLVLLSTIIVFLR